MEGQSKGLYDLLDKQNFMKKQNTNKLYIGDTVTNRLNISDNFKDKSTTITPTPSPSKSSENDLAKKLEYDTLEKNIEQNVTTFYDKIIEFFDKIDTFLSNIDYKNTYIQITILVCFVYVIINLIGILHININIP